MKINGRSVVRAAVVVAVGVSSLMTTGANQRVVAEPIAGFETAELVADLEQAPVFSDWGDSNAVVVGDYVYLFVDNGIELLWEYNVPTAALRQVDMSALTSVSETAVAYFGELVFGGRQDDGAGGTEPVLAKLTPGGAPAIVKVLPDSVADLAAGSSAVYFSLDGEALWESDLTDANTVELATGLDRIDDIHATPRGDGTEILYFEADGSNGQEPHRFDPDVGVTAFDVATGAADSRPFDLHTVGNAAYFRARDAAGVTNLYRLAGADVTLVAPELLQSRPDVVIGSGTRIFTAFPNGGGTELAYYDHLADTFVTVVADFPSVQDGFSLGPSGALLAVSPDPGESALWYTDGTTLGTIEVRNGPPLSLGNGSSLAGGADAPKASALFVADDGSGEQLWRYNPAPALSSFELSPANPDYELSSAEFFVSAEADQWVFPAWDADVGFEPFNSNGTSATTDVIGDLTPGTDGSRPGEFAPFEGGIDLLIQRDSTPFSNEILSVDANGAPTVVELGLDDGDRIVQYWREPSGSFLMRVDRGSSDAFVRSTGGVATELGTFDESTNGGLLQSGDRFYFERSGSPQGRVASIKTDGTDLVELGEIGFEDALPYADGVIFRSAASVPGEQEPWFSDGTVAGTGPLGDLRSGSSFPGGFTEFDGTVYFTTSTRAWTTDATPAGTVELEADLGIDEIGAVGDLGVLVRDKGDLFFVTSPNGDVVEVADPDYPNAPALQFWQREATTSHAVSAVLDGGVTWIGVVDGDEYRAIELPLGSNDSVEDAVAHRGVAYFIVNRNDATNEIIRTDGTAGGTGVIWSQRSGIDEIDDIWLSGDRLFFDGWTESFGEEVWTIDLQPSAPTGVTAVAGDAVATVSWVAPTDPGSLPITGYTVTASPGGATCTTTGAVTCEIVGLANGTAYTFTVTMTSGTSVSAPSDPSAAVTPMEPPPPFDDVETVAPARLLDTRDSGETVDGRFEKIGRVGAGGQVELEVTGRGGVAPDAAAVVLNVTMIRPDGNGFVTVHPCGERPLASSMNAPSGGGVVANEVIAKLSATGTVCLYSSVGTNLAADVTGYVPASSGVASVEPARLLDTRATGETADGRFERTGRLTADSFVELDVVGRLGVPDDASSVVLNVTMIRPDGNGFVTIYPCGERPLASSMNAPAGGGVVANEVIAKVSSTGTVCLYSSVGTNLAADVTGFVPDVSGVASVEPARLLDTRPTGETADDLFEKTGKLGADSFVELDVLGRGDVPSSGVSSVVLNVTMIRPDGNGFVTIYPCDVDRPLASSMNAPVGGGVVANEVIAKVSATGTVCLYSSVGTNLAADVTGYVAT